MKGWVAGPELRDDLPEPSGSVVAVRATSVNSIDTRTREGVLGWDFAGVTSGGAEVFGFTRGAWAERVEAGPFAAPKPASLTMAEAGAAGAAGTFALANVEAAGLRGGERVLVVGANGGAGSIAVQLCIALGCSVVAPALEIDEPFLRGLGVSEVVARDERPAADVVLDFVQPAPGVTAMDDPARVARLGELIDRHSIRVPICEAFSFGEVPSALEAFGDHKQGKLSIM